MIKTHEGALKSSKNHLSSIKYVLTIKKAAGKDSTRA
jgi:hypothetical protein